jgi:hypothetical protein
MGSSHGSGGTAGLAGSVFSPPHLKADTRGKMELDYFVKLDYLINS